MASTRALINAAKRGDKDGVLRCLQRGADIEGTDEESRTALSLAISNNHADVAITLLEKGANPNWRPDLKSSTLLMRAINHDLINVASLLIEKGARVNDCDVLGYTALMFTPKRDHEDLPLKLIKHGAKVNARDNKKYTSFHWATVLNSPTVLRVLLANGADINAVNKHGETASDIAKKNQYSEIEAILKAHGQDIGTFTEMRQLNAALQSRVVGMEESRRVHDERLAGRINELENEKNGVLRCWQRGADIVGTVEGSQTALYLAITNNHAAVAINLLEKGANPNWRPDLKSPTLLMRAINLDLTNVASLLIDKGARVNDCSGGGYTALMFTLRRGHEDLALKLVKHGAQVNARDNQKHTSLHWASMYNHPAVLRVLLANGADINAISKLGETALFIAKEKHYSEIEAILKAHSQDIGKFTEMRQLIAALQSRVVGMEESRRVHDERLAGRIHELENGKNVMEIKIENFLKQNSIKDRQLTELKMRVVGMEKSRRVSDERLAGRINKLENGKNVMETKIENLLWQNYVKDRQLTELKTLVDGMGEPRRVHDERLAGRILELENGKNEMETKIENLLRQNSIKDRQLTELKTRVDGIEESQRVNVENLVGRLDELQSEKSVMKTKIENIARQNSVKDGQLTELKMQVEQNFIQNNQIELETRLESLRVEFDEMKRENRLKDEQLDQVKNATEALGVNGITQSPKSSFSRVLSENLTEKVRILETKLNDSEQDKMVDTIEISGIEERPSENLNVVLFAVARALDLPFPTDLVRVSRQPAFVPEVGKRPRVILVKFKKAETARNWLKAFKDKRSTGIVASELDASFKDEIFVNQKLTSFNKKLLRRVKEFAKGKEYQYVWVQDGKILLRKNRDSPIIRIKTNNDIPSR